MFQKEGREYAFSEEKEHDALQSPPAEGQKTVGLTAPPCLTAPTCCFGGGGRLWGDNPPFPVLLLCQLWTLFFLQPFDEFVESGCQGQHCPIALGFLLQPVWVQLLLCLECPKQEWRVKGLGGQSQWSTLYRRALVKFQPSLQFPFPTVPLSSSKQPPGGCSVLPLGPSAHPASAHRAVGWRTWE